MARLTDLMVRSFEHLVRGRDVQKLDGIELLEYVATMLGETTAIAVAQNFRRWNKEGRREFPVYKVSTKKRQLTDSQAADELEKIRQRIASESDDAGDAN